MTQSISQSLAVLVTLFMLGCNSGGRPGFPNQSYDETAEIQRLAEKFNRADMIGKYFDLPPSTSPELRREKRNEIIAASIALIDLNYNKFIAETSSAKQAFDFTTDMGELGVNLATAAVGSASTKTILGAVSAGLTGARISINKNFFYEETVPVLVSAMNAARKKALESIERGLGKSAEEYSLPRTIADLQSYYFAGTFMGALQAIQQDAATKEKKATEDIEAIRTANFGKDAARKVLYEFVYPLNKENEKVIQAWMVKNGLTEKTIAEFINSNDSAMSEKRLAAVQPVGGIVGIPTMEPAVAKAPLVQRSLQLFWKPKNDANENTLLVWMKTNGIDDVPIGFFLNADGYTEKRMKAVMDLKVEFPQ